MRLAFLITLLFCDGLQAQDPFDPFWNVQVSAAVNVLVFDDFNRADGPLGNAVVGGAWSSGAGVMDIVGNAAHLSTGSLAWGFINTGVADVSIQATQPIMGGAASFAGILFRYSDDNNYWRLVNFNGDTYLQKSVIGVVTTLVGPTSGAANSDVLKVVLSGNTIKAYRNGVQLGTDQSDSFNSTATRHGIFGALTSAASVDDITVWQ